MDLDRIERALREGPADEPRYVPGTFRGRSPERLPWAMAAFAAVAATALVAALLIGVGLFLRSLNVGPPPVPGPTHSATPSPTEPPTTFPASLPLVISVGWTHGAAIWNADTGSWRTLTDEIFMAIAPDGSWFGYREYSCSECPIRIAPIADGGPSARLAYADAPNPFTPANQWLAESPDGHFVVRMTPGALELVDLDGGPAAWTTSDPLPLRVIEVPQIGDTINVGTFNMAWSPDARTIGLVADDGNIYLVDVASGGVRQITDAGAFVEAGNYAPTLVWSHDGTRILTSDAQRDLWVVAVPGGAARQLEVRLLGKVGGYWSTDDTRIGYEYGYLTLADGTTRSLAGAAGGCDMEPLWSGSTNQLVAIIDGALTIRPDVSPRVLGTDICREGEPVQLAWSPDEAWIAVLTLQRVLLFPVAGGEPTVLIRHNVDTLFSLEWPGE